MNTFLPPIEKPDGLMKKLAYYFTRKQFGKVSTPVKVHSAWLPAAFGLFYAKIGSLDKKLTLPREMVLLIREQVARLNVCSFCMDIGRSFAIKEMMSEAKFDALDQYRTSSLFTDAERDAFRDWQALGLKDAFRLFEQPEKTFSWWDYRQLAFPKNHGLRIDHILLSPALAAACTSCRIDRQARKGEKPSDHAPVVAELAG